MMDKNQPRKKRRRVSLKGLSRVFVYLLFINAIGVWWTVASAKSAFGEKSLEFGRGLEKLSSKLKGANQININGQSMHILVSDSSATVEETLENFEKGCRRMNSGIEDLLKDAPEEKREEVRQGLGGRPLSALGVMTSQTGEGDTLEGTVLCIVSKDKQREIPITDRLVSFMETGDLAELGELRYIYVKKPSSGKAASHVRMMWTEGSYDFFHMFAKDGRDAPGTDPTSAPRPREATRLIDANATGQPHNVWLYDSARSVEQVMQDYDTDMAGTAWNADPFVSSQVEGARHFYNEHGSDLVIYAQPDKNGGSSVTIVESNPAGPERLRGTTPITKLLEEQR